MLTKDQTPLIPAEAQSPWFIFLLASLMGKENQWTTNN